VSVWDHEEKARIEPGIYFTFLRHAFLVYFVACAASPNEPRNHSKDDDEENTLLSILSGDVVDHRCGDLRLIDMSVTCRHWDGDGDCFVLKLAFEARMRC
jgi:hypothetical protein